MGIKMPNSKSTIRKTKNFTPRQAIAIKSSIEFGITLQIEHPEIADWYRQGATARNILERLGYSEEEKNRLGVQKAISGHKGGARVDAYVGLIPSEEEREDLAMDHWQKASSVTGSRLYQEGRGMFSRTSEELTEVANKLWEAGKGVHARSKKKMSEDGRKSAVARGFVPWFRVGDEMGKGIYCCVDEVVYAYWNSQQNDCKEKGGTDRQRVNVTSMLFKFCEE